MKTRRWMQMAVVAYLACASCVWAETPRAPSSKVYPCPVPTDPSSCYRSGNTSTGSYSGGSGNNLNTINAIGNAIGGLLDSSNRATEAEEQRRDAEIKRQHEIEMKRIKVEVEQSKKRAVVEADALINAASNDSANNPWANTPKQEKGNEAPPKLSNCDCTRIVGTCYGSVWATPISPSGTRATYGAELSIRSDVPRCAKVSYYVDSTPYFNVLSQGNSTTDSVWGQRPVTKDTITGVSCQVCSSTGQ